MSVLFRLQENVPEVYCNESRDFQLLCRLYDCIINGVKYDVDSMSYLTSTENCKSNILSLLQTKVGFFSNLKYNDDDLRYILSAFIDMTRNKGSILAIKQAVNVYLKLNHITSNIRIWYVSDSSLVYGTEVSDHTIVLGLNTALKNMQILDELMRFVLPTGFGFFFYFYTSIDIEDDVDLYDKAELLFASDNISSQVRGSVDNYTSNSFKDRIMGSIDKTFIASNDSLVPTENGTYEAADDSMFLGMYNSLSERPSTADKGTYCIVKTISLDDTNREYWQAYVYAEAWEEVTFHGQVNSLPSTSSSTKNDIIGITSTNIYYFCRSSAWSKVNFRGKYDSLSKVVSPKALDCVRIPSSIEGNEDIYYVYWNASTGWVEVSSFENYNRIDDAIKSTNALALINGVTYYMFNGTSWVDNTLAMYNLIDSIKEK